MQGTIFPLPCRPGACGVGGVREALLRAGAKGRGRHEGRDRGVLGGADIYSILPHGYSNPEGAFWGPSRAFV